QLGGDVTGRELGPPVRRRGARDLVDAAADLGTKNPDRGRVDIADLVLFGLRQPRRRDQNAGAGGADGRAYAGLVPLLDRTGKPDHRVGLDHRGHLLDRRDGRAGSFAGLGNARGGRRPGVADVGGLTLRDQEDDQGSGGEGQRDPAETTHVRPLATV